MSWFTRSKVQQRCRFSKIHIFMICFACVCVCVCLQVSILRSFVIQREFRGSNLVILQFSQ
jgi:hypothetical protein